jgi:hypothetical protein
MKRAIHTATALCFGVSALLGPGLAAWARPIVPAERREIPFSGHVAACNDGNVLNAITERFQTRESAYWSSGLKLLGFDDIRDQGYRTDGYDYIPRRYCQARAAFNDDKYRQVVYWIGEGQGFAGYGFGVEWCIQGLDRNYAFAPACQSARP